MAQVRLASITKKFGETTVIPKLDLDIADREFVVLVGPSGCGKTTTLRMIAGLEEASGGNIFVGERDVTNLRPGLRNCSMVFQNYALYPHMSVRITSPTDSKYGKLRSMKLTDWSTRQHES